MRMSQSGLARGAPAQCSWWPRQPAPEARWAPGVPGGDGGGAAVSARTPADGGGGELASADTGAERAAQPAVRRPAAHVPGVPARHCGPVAARSAGSRSPRRPRYRGAGRAGVRLGRRGRPGWVRRRLPGRRRPHLERRHLLRAGRPPAHRRPRLPAQPARRPAAERKDRPAPHRGDRHLERRPDGLRPRLPPSRPARRDRSGGSHPARALPGRPRSRSSAPDLRAAHPRTRRPRTSPSPVGRDQGAGGEPDRLAPVQDVIEAWRQMDGCGAPVVRVKGSVTRSTSACADASAVALVTIRGAGHQWPGAAPPRLPFLDPPSTALDATSALGAFFAAHPLAGS